MPEGVIYFRDVQGGRQLVIEYEAKKSRPVAPLRPERLAPGLLDALKVEERIDVDFDRENNQIVRVRRKGETWPEPQEPQVMPGAHFHNPYNFAPTPCVKAQGPLGRGLPCGHASYVQGRYEGSLRLALTATSPLLLLDPARARTTDRHVALPVMRGADDRPALRPTSLKGALRAGFEIVTNSRFGVFANHGDPLARRMDARHGLAMVPARVLPGDRLELLPGAHAALGWPRARPVCNAAGTRWSVPGGNEMYAAWLFRYDRAGFNGSGPALHRSRRTYPRGVEPLHGQEVVCWLRLIEYRRGNVNFSYWEVVDIAPGGSVATLPPTASSARGAAVIGGPIQAHGYVCVTGQNIGRKHDERVFFKPPGATPIVIPLDEKWRTAWKALIANYQALHADAIEERRAAGRTADAYLGSDIGKTAFSRHVFTAADRDLAPGALCYARVDPGGVITGLYPVMISRELAKFAPDRLVDPAIGPADALHALSPADRVFGWVRQGRDEGHGARSAYKGHVRVRSVRCTTDAEQAIHRFPDGGLPLAILSTPKPQRAGFYARNGADYDKSDTRLSGRKVYPHHRIPEAEAADYWDPDGAMRDATTAPPQPIGARFREYVRRPQGTGGGLPPMRDSQNRSIEEWVNPGAEFDVEIRFDNLDAVELGALMTVCAPGDGRFLRIGYGKPLGFGSVASRIVSVEINGHAALRADYADLVPAASPAASPDRWTDVAAAVAHFVPAFEAECRMAGLGACLEAFRRSAAGPGDGAPTHYPRRRAGEDGGTPPPDPDGKNYEWFRDHPGVGLPELGKPGLPY